MNPTRWAQIDHLLDEALERAPQERASFLADACGGDQELRREVESLLQAHAQAADGFLQAPALEVAAKNLAGESHRSLVGQMLGPYSVISALGAGGMGEIYLARDTRLSRKVALKLLPKQFTADAARVRRFETEARAASALNHPNILTIYEIGRVGAEHFIAAEYIDGVTIREQLNQGKLAIKEALEIAVQIASALAAAHEAGIVHRDIKPENVMRRRDDYVKVLDFGLAKLTERHPSLAHTRGDDADIGQTNPGTVLGTISYMSPEQSLGYEVDRRTDIFSLGVLLYEMLAGVVPFKGTTNAALLDAIVHHQPLALTAVRADAPVELEHIIKRALEKDRELRYQTASDLRADLKLLQRKLESAPASSFSHNPSRRALPKPARKISKLWSGLAAITLLVVIGLAWWRWTADHDAPLAWSRAAATRLTGFGGEELFPAFSPDGKEFVYARNEKNNWDIYQQRLTASEARNLTEDSPEDDTQPAYSPNGDWIAFRSERRGGGIFVMGATGEAARQLTNFGYHPDWSPNSKEIVFSSVPTADPTSRGSYSRLHAVNVVTGQLREIPAGRDAVQPRYSPKGLRLAFWGRNRGVQRDIWTVAPQGGDLVQVTNDEGLDWNPVWAPDGKFIYFISNRKGAPSLWRVPVDEASGRATGEVEPLIGPLAQSWQLNIAPDGRRLIYVEKQSRENIYAVNFDPLKYQKIGEPFPILESARRSSAPDVAPDGQRLTFYSRGETNEDLFVMKTDGTGLSQLTNDAASDRLPRWAPDGKRIIYYSNVSRSYEIWAINPDGSGRQQLSFNNGQSRGFNKGLSIVYPLPSPDGRWIAYCVAAGETFLLDAQKTWQEQQPQALPFIEPEQVWFIAWSWSPDAQKLAGWSSNRNGEIDSSYIYSLASRQFEKIADLGRRQYWLSDNRHLLCIDGGRIYLLDSQTHNTREILEIPRREIRSASIAPDRRRIYFSLVADESDIRMLTLE